MKMSSRLLMPFKDCLRHSKTIRSLASLMEIGRGKLSSHPVLRATRQARAIELAESPAIEAAALAALQEQPGIENASIWREVVASLSRYRTLTPALTRSIILKAPGEGGEKGVLLMTFEYNWARLLLGIPNDEFRWIDEHYDLVLSTSWSPTDYAMLAFAVSKVRGTVFVQSCNYDEVKKIECFHPRLKCLPTLPCDWINPELYQPKPFTERTTDIVMVANWGEFKRHWDLFRALAAMPPNLKVVLIGQKEGNRDKEFILNLARQFGARQQLEIYESIPIHEVAAHQCKAKVSLIMSRREGCCVAAVESLFAGCALGMRADAHVGPIAYINKQTGKRLRPGRIAEDIASLLEESRTTLRPREWAIENLACQVSHRRVNDFLRDMSIQAGKPWARDIAMPHWRPHPTFANHAQQEYMRPAYAKLRERWPQVFPESLRSESWR